MVQGGVQGGGWMGELGCTETDTHDVGSLELGF